MPSELSQTIVLADYNVAIVKLHHCGCSFVNRLSLVCRLTCVAVSVSLIRYCSPFVLHHAEPTADGACCLIAEGLMHLSITKPVGVHKWKSSCLVYSVEFHQPLTCVKKDIFHIPQHCTVPGVPKLRSEFIIYCDRLNRWLKETNCPKSAAYLANYPGNCLHSVRMTFVGAPEMEACTMVAFYKS